MGNISKTLGKLLEKTYPLKKKDTDAIEPTWTLLMGKWGTEKEEENMEYAHKKRNVLQKEIDNRKKDLEKQQKERKQRELLMAWKEAADYPRENQTNIKYSRTPIIGLNKRTKTHRTSREKNRRKQRFANMSTGSMAKHLEKTL